MLHTKRSLLLVVYALFLSLILVGCFGGGNTSTDPTAEDQNSEQSEENGTEEEGTDGGPASGGIDLSEVDPTSITDFSQSPFLDDMDLPDVEERLPEVPKVVNELLPEHLDFEIGQYGGTIRTATNDTEFDPDVFVMSNESLINTPSITGETFTPNILENYEVNDEQTQFTFYLREGLKWSDGEPVTMEDVEFAIKDVLFNEELTPTFPIWLRDQGAREGEPMQFEVIDDYAFQISFNEPYGGFIARVAIQGWRGYHDFMKPAHYLQQYHADYASEEELDVFMEEEELNGDWTELFDIKDIVNTEMTSRDAIGFPVLYPWMITNYSDGVSTFERNPYYFKVDPEGNQLPYVDRLQSRLVEDQEMVTLEVMSGGLDLVRENAALNNMPIYRENEENGGYVAKLYNMHLTPTDISLNLTYEDETWQEVVQDVRFRRALNMAINRDEIIDAIYYGFAEPSTITDSTFDPEQANQLLDEMGMEIGSDGYRRAPSGDDFRIDITIADHSPDFIPLTELIREYWRDLSLNVTMQTVDIGLWDTRNQANELMATMMWTHTALWHNPDYHGYFGRDWADWYDSGGEDGEEPPAELLTYFDLVDQLWIVPVEEAIDVDQQIKDEIGEHVWYFVHIENVQQPMILNADLGNVPGEDSGVMAIAVNFSGEQLFYRTAQ